MEFTGKKKKLTGRTRNNYKGIFATFFGFARDRGYLPRGVDTEAQHMRRTMATPPRRNKLNILSAQGERMR